MTSRPLFKSLPFAYGVAEGEAEGEADSSAAGVAFFFAVFFGDADGDASVEADVEVFFAVELFLAEVDVPCVVVAPVDVVASSFFCDWQPRKAVSINTVIKDKTGVFIGLVKLNEDRECRSLPERASTKMDGFLLSNM